MTTGKAPASPKSNIAVVEADDDASDLAALKHKIATIPLDELGKEELSAKIAIQSEQQIMVRSQTLDRVLTDEQIALGNLGAFHGIGPADTIEEMMAVQLIGLHNATVESLYRAGHPKICEEISLKYLNAASKTSRAFAGLVEVMDKHRGDRQQKVLVEHVHVHAGGQAIVGSIEGAGGNAKKRKA